MYSFIKNAIPRPLYYWARPIYHRVKLFLNPPTLPNRKDGKILLHLGCGLTSDKNFINIDSYPYPHVHYIRDICSPKLWDKENADLIYTSHALEHIERAKVPEVLQNWYSFLKPGGILRISVPDYDGMHRIYELLGNDIEVISPPLMGGQHNKFDFHYSVFNKKFLTKLLKQVGFSNVRDWNPNNCNFHDFKDCANFCHDNGSEKVWVSINIEAIK